MDRMPEIKQLKGYNIEEIDLRRYVKSILNAQFNNFQKELKIRNPKFSSYLKNKRRKKNG